MPITDDKGNVWRDEPGKKKMLVTDIRRNGKENIGRDFCNDEENFAMRPRNEKMIACEIVDLCT